MGGNENLEGGVVMVKIEIRVGDKLDDYYSEIEWLKLNLKLSLILFTGPFECKLIIKEFWFI